MIELTQGTKVHLTNGKVAVVENELGRGGQGIVYAVTVEGKKMALKWYIDQPADNFYKNLEQNVKNGSPSSVFLWPKYLTEKENGSYGYVMDIRPEGYYEFSSILMAKHNFESYHAILVAAMEICEGFKALHAQGLGFQCINDDYFLIEPKSGHVLINYDNDSFSPYGEDAGIMGKARYMAPEVVCGNNTPDKYSDRFSLSVILFLLFYGNHPFEGTKVVTCPSMTETYEKKFYGSDILFICDQEDQSNCPVRGLHTNVLTLWPLFPEVLRQTFITEFSKDRLNNPTKRLTELMWQQVITSVRDSMVICPHCKNETFVSTGGTNKCDDCGCSIAIPNTLIIDRRTLFLSEGNLLYIDRDEIPDIQVIRDSKDPNMLLLKNISSSKWSVDTPSGRTNIVEPEGIMPVKKGLIISFGSFSKKGTIQ